MKLVVFGLSISSSWGNGHATLWRGLLRALRHRGCQSVFYEHDTPYYAGARDSTEFDGCSLILYDDWSGVVQRARADLRDADACIITSYCPDALVAAELAAENVRALSVFYDLDTPVTLAELAGSGVSYIGPRGLRDFDLVLSYTGGGALTELAKRLGARRVAPLVGHVDPQAHHPAPAASAYRGDLSYLGTYAPDRQAALEELFLHPARCAPARRFVIAGAQYPVNFGWLANIHFVRHLPPSEHPGFFCSSRLTLNVTRAPMAQMGWCPSGRLFEAAACGAAIVSDEWDGLEDFFARDSEILIARASDDVLRALDMDDAQLARIGRAARERVMAQHTSDHRAAELIAALDSVRRSELAEA